MNTERSITDFLSFRWLISPAVIRAVYVVGATAITIWAAWIIFGALALSDYSGVSEVGWLGLLWGLAVFVFGNLAWRLLCESFIVLFQIADELSEIRDSLPETLHNLGKPLESMTQRFREGVQELAAIKEELREGVSFTDLRETLASLTEQFERGTAQFAAVGQALQEEISRSELQNALMMVAQRLEEGAERLARLEEHHFEAAMPPLSASPAPAHRPEPNPDREEAPIPSRRRVLTGALTALGLILVGTGLFVGLPLAAGSIGMPSLDPQSLRDFLADAWAYWVSLIQGKAG